MNFIIKFLDICIPRFIDEDVALVNVDGQLEIVCSMKDVEQDEVFDGIVTIRGFNFFGFMLFSKCIGEVRPFKL